MMKKFIYTMTLVLACASCVSHKSKTAAAVETKSCDSTVISALAQKVNADTRLQEVSKRAELLIGSGLNAGDGYSEVWIRDLNTFIETACQVSDQSKLRDALLNFFRFQQKDGDILDGYTLKKNTAGSKGFYYYSKLAPEYAGHKNTVETDQETSLIQAIYKYTTISGDTLFLKEVIDGKSVEQRMADAFNFLLKDRYSKKYGLIYGATTVDWGDVSPEKGGCVRVTDKTKFAIDIYDNAMFLIAIKDYTKMLKDATQVAFWNNKYQEIAANTMKYLWDTKNEKFIPHLYLNGSPFSASFDENKIYYHGGTAVAIEAGLLNKDQIKAAYKRMQQDVKDAKAQTIGLTIYPVYPASEWKFNVMKPYEYQNGGDWTWFGGRMVQQLIAYGLYDEAYEALSPMLDRVIKNNGFYEWYRPNGEPKGSSSFRGSAGVLWVAIKDLKKSKL